MFYSFFSSIHGVKVLRQFLFDVQLGNSNLAKGLDEKSNHVMYQNENPHRACYPCKMTKTNHFFSHLLTSIHETNSFLL